MIALKEIPTDLVVMQPAGAAGQAILIAANYDGEVEAWSKSAEACRLLYRKKIFSTPIRRLAAFPDATHLLAASSTGDIAVLRDGEIVRQFEPLLTTDEDPVEVSSVCLTEPDSSVDEFSLAVGDDMGNILILSAKPSQPKLSLLMLVQEQDDSITSLVHQKRRKTLLASSGDGTIVVVDLKRLKIVAHSTSLDDEITAMAVDCHGDVICGTGLGAIVKYKWGYWGKVANRIRPKAHRNATISAMLADTRLEPSFLTGTADGVVSLVREGEAPCIVGQIEDSIEAMGVLFSHDDQKFVALTATNDASVHILPISTAAAASPSAKANPEDTPSTGLGSAVTRKGKKKSAAKERSELQTSFFKDL
jgi:WD40 repeat protein